ncbi:MAG: response regulator [Myxococcota bacterium]
MSDLKRRSSEMATVLVVDDEQMLGRVIDRFLRRDYEVIAVTSAQEALDILEEHDDINCILCDLMMPGMTGMEFYSELVERFPAHAASVAFLSGGTFTTEANTFISDGGHALIEKPFRPDQLREVVGDLV